MGTLLNNIVYRRIISMKLRKRIMTSGIVAAAMLSGSIYVGCGGSKGLLGDKDKETPAPSDEKTSIVLTGQLALSGAPTTLALAGTVPELADLNIYCVTFQLPPVAGTGAIGSDGAFELTLEAKDTSVGCFILNGEDVLGTLVFEDPSKKDLAGGSKSHDRLGFAGGKSDLGAFTLDLATGKAIIDISKIVSERAKDNTAATAGAVDFTGSYTISSAGPEKDLPKGYVGACPKSARLGGGPDGCNGPPEGEPLWLKTIKGTDVASGKPAHGLMIWQSEDLFNTCGGKLGFSYDQGKEHGVDFSASDVGEGDFTWDPSLVDGWKDRSAHARNSMMKMENVAAFKGFSGTKQYFKQYRVFNCEPGSPCSEGTPVIASGFQFHANTNDSGCKDSDNKPVQMNDWQNMKCESTDLTGESEGLRKNTCSKEYEGKTVTCVNIGGTFAADGSSIPGAMTRYPDDYVVYAKGAYCDYNKDGQAGGDEWPNYNGNEQSCRAGTTLTEGDLCKDISDADDAGKLAQLRCYLEGSQGGDKGGEQVKSCQREVRGNWSATTPDEFLGKADGAIKAKGEHIFELFDYDSATSGSLRGEDREFRGIQVGNDWTDCEVINVFSIALRKIDGGNDLMAEMSETQKNVSTKPACIAEFDGEGKTKKMLFKLVKN
jgi:hypothetical protein